MRTYMYIVFTLIKLIVGEEQAVVFYENNKRRTKMEGEMTKLKVGGAWTGTVEVSLNVWTVGMLRNELASRCGGCSDAELKVICAGKNLKPQDSGLTLSTMGVRPNSRVLVTRTSSPSQAQEALDNQQQATTRLERICAAAEAIAKRHIDNAFPQDNFNIELENQSGQKMTVGSETDQKAVFTGLMLHQKGQNWIKEKRFKDAIDILMMSEEAFSVCHPTILEMIDNVSLPQIDIVWCYFMLKDISNLSVAGQRLKEARKGLERCYGANMERARILNGGYCPELVVFTRLELLEGIVAYHSGLLEESHKSLESAQQKYKKLQVSDEALSTVASIGFTTEQARRALRMSGQDVERAIEFALIEQEKAIKKTNEDIEHKRLIREQKSYGKTQLGKAVDMKMVNSLVSIGYEKLLAAEALRKNENDMEKALDELTNPLSNAALQSHLEARKTRKRKSMREAAVAELTSMGFMREQVERALSQFASKDEAIDFLLQNLGNSDSNVHGVVAGTSDQALHSEEILTEESTQAVSDIMSTSQVNADTVPTNIPTSRDWEIEDEITNNIVGDAFADYDIDVQEEGKAIEEYLSLFSSLQSNT